MSAGASRAGQQGLTLLEVLVTLVIMGLVAGIVSQALFQVARIEQRLAGTQLLAMNETLRLEWVRSALEGLLPGDEGSADRLAGDDRGLQGLSAETPGFPVPGLARIRLSLEYDAARQSTALWLRPLQTEAAPAAQPLLRWPGRVGSLQYLDTQGAWHDQWPPGPPAKQPALPRAIRLETGLDGTPTVLAVTRASVSPLISRRTLERL